MAEKILQTRLLLKYDSYSNWTTNNPVLKAGQAAVAYIASGNTQEVNQITAPQVLIKVGDGTSTYNALPFISAKSADVYSWAKAANKPSYTASQISGIGKYISDYVQDTMGIETDTNTVYQITKTTTNGNTVYKLQSQNKGDSTWTDVANSTIDLSTIETNIASLQDLVGDTAISTLLEGYSQVGHTHSTSDITDLQTTLDGKVSTIRKINNKDLSADITLTASDIGAISSSLKGAANGVAQLDSTGKVPSAQLPSFVDDVIEGYVNNGKFYSTKSGNTFSDEITGQTGKIYVDLTDNRTYRWSGSVYTLISSSLALGTTSSTAYRGDYGAAAYTHAVTNKGAAFASGMYKITTNAEGHVTSATAVTKSDITGLGIASTDVASTTSNGLMSKEDKTNLNNVVSRVGTSSVADQIASAIDDQNLQQYAKDEDLATIAKTGNANDLIQTSGDVLVLNCGSSSINI